MPRRPSAVTPGPIGQSSSRVARRLPSSRKAPRFLLMGVDLSGSDGSLISLTTAPGRERSRPNTGWTPEIFWSVQHSGLALGRNVRQRSNLVQVQCSCSVGKVSGRARQNFSRKRPTTHLLALAHTRCWQTFTGCHRRQVCPTPKSDVGMTPPLRPAQSREQLHPRLRAVMEGGGGRLSLLEQLDRRIHLDAAEHPGLVSRSEGQHQPPEAATAAAISGPMSDDIGLVGTGLESYRH